MSPYVHGQDAFSILLCDDSGRFAAVRARLALDFALYDADSWERADAILSEHAREIGLVICDQRMISPEGLALAEIAAEKYPRMERMVLTGEADLAPLQQALNDGVLTAFAPETSDWCALTQLVRLALERCALRRQLEAARSELLQHEQDAVFSFLSAGIGHEVNNPVSVLKMNFEALGESIDDLASLAGQRDGVIHEDVDEIASNVKSILSDSSFSVNMLENMAHDLRVLGTPPGRNPKAVPADPNGAVARAMRLLARQAGYRASVESRLEAVPLVMADERGLAQVVINLLTNAMRSVEAIGDERERRIRVETMATGNQVLVRVDDNGPGSSDSGCSHPGLGLSLCRTLVESWDGTFEVEARPEGRTYTARLLKAELPAEDDATQSRTFAAVGAVLVVDDDPMVLRAIERCLGKLYRVATASSGTRAWELLETREFDAVLCDLHMAPPDGPALFHMLRERSPAMAGHVAFMTAGSSTPQGQQFIDEALRSGLRILRKPLTSAQVRRAVAELISRS